MNAIPNLMMAMLLGAFLCTAAAPASAAQRTVGDGTPKVTDGDSTKSGSPGTPAKETQVKKKRRSSGKQIIEDTTTEETEKSDSMRSPGGKAKSSGKTSEFGSGGGGVTGATGR